MNRAHWFAPGFLIRAPKVAARLLLPVRIAAIHFPSCHHWLTRRQLTAAQHHRHQSDMTLVLFLCESRSELSRRAPEASA